MKKASYYQRNRKKLQAYQREYARRKRAPGRRKVSKVERQLLEEQYINKQSLMEIEGALQTNSPAYMCVLIVCSRAVDPRRTESMAEKEENARKYFEELKDELPTLLPRWWKKYFKHYIDKYIGELLDEKEFVAMVPCEDKEEEESQRICLHGIRRLVAGTAQEWELAQQPKYAATCAKLDGALVWQGRGVNLRKFRQLYGW